MWWTTNNLLAQLKSIASTQQRILAELAPIHDNCDILIGQFKELVQGQREIISLLKQIKHIMHVPEVPRVQLLKEIEMDVIRFAVALRNPRSADVVKRHLKVTINEDVVFDDVVSLNVDTVGNFEGPEGAIVSAYLVDIDNAGNQSKAAVLTEVLRDVFPPAQPEMSLQLVEEVHVEPTPAPEPAPEPMPAPEPETEPEPPVEP